MSSTSDQRPTVQFDANTNEPFMLVPGQSNFRLTPIKRSDTEDLLRLYNHPSIGKWAKRRPFPYAERDTDFVFDFLYPRIELGLAELTRYSKDHTITPRPVGIFPLGALRCHPQDGTGDLDMPSGRVVGVISFVPYGEDGVEYEEMIKRPGKEQVWEVAYDLLPDVAGRGLGKGMTRSALAWAELVGIGKAVAAAEKNNVPSTALLKSLGFVEAKRWMQAWPEVKGGGERELVLWGRALPLL